MIPIFKSHFSLNSSLLTLEPAEEIKDNLPASVFSVAKKHGLKDVYLVDSSMSGFLQAFSGAKKSELNLRYGVELTVVSNIKDKSEESLKTEHTIIVWLLNSEGYPDLCKLVTCANIEGFYYRPRIDEESLAKLLTPNLMVTIPFYGSFLANNSLKFATCVFNYERFNSIFFKEYSNLPFDQVIENKINSLKVSTQPVKTVYYYRKSDFPAFMTVKCIGKRSTWDKPNLDGMASDDFAFETFLEQTK
jgi:DNA polymerase III alpha subunit